MVLLFKLSFVIVFFMMFVFNLFVVLINLKFYIVVGCYFIGQVLVKQLFSLVFKPQHTVALVCFMPPIFSFISEAFKLEMVLLFKLSLLIDFFMIFVFLVVSCFYRCLTSQR